MKSFILKMFINIKISNKKYIKFLLYIAVKGILKSNIIVKKTSTYL